MEQERPKMSNRSKGGLLLQLVGLAILGANIGRLFNPESTSNFPLVPIGIGLVIAGMGIIYVDRKRQNEEKK